MAIDLSLWREALSVELHQAQERSVWSSGAERWMRGWAIVATLILACFYLSGGYHAAFLAINGLARDFGDGFWQCVTVLGDGRLVLALPLLFARRRPEILWTMMLTALFAALLTHGLKPWVGALRPPAVLAEGSFFLNGPGYRHNSFPSGHSMTIAAFLAVWVCLVRDWRLRLALILFSYEIAASRVVVGVHWPVDVAAGILGGCLSAWAGCRLAAVWRWGLSLKGHLFCLAFCLLAGQSLFYDDGGYALAAWFQLSMGALCFAAGIKDYLLPLYREVRFHV